MKCDGVLLIMLLNLLENMTITEKYLKKDSIWPTNWLETPREFDILEVFID